MAQRYLTFVACVHLNMFFLTLVAFALPLLVLRVDATERVVRDEGEQHGKIQNPLEAKKMEQAWKYLTFDQKRRWFRFIAIRMNQQSTQKDEQAAWEKDMLTFTLGKWGDAVSFTWNTANLKPGHGPVPQTWMLPRYRKSTVENGDYETVIKTFLLMINKQPEDPILDDKPGSRLGTFFELMKDQFDQRYVAPARRPYFKREFFPNPSRPPLAAPRELNGQTGAATRAGAGLARAPAAAGDSEERRKRTVTWDASVERAAAERSAAKTGDSVIW